MGRARHRLRAALPPDRRGPAGPWAIRYPGRRPGPDRLEQTADDLATDPASPRRRARGRDRLLARCPDRAAARHRPPRRRRRASSSRARRPGSRIRPPATRGATADEALATRIERDGIAAFVAEWEAQPIFATHAALPPARALGSAPSGSPTARPASPRACAAPARARWSRSTTASPRSAAPTLVIAGALDDAGRPRAERVAAGIPGARLADRRRRRAHAPRRAPTAFRRLALDFLEEDPPHDRRHLDAGRRVPGHPLRALGDRHRQGHDRPPGGPQRVPAADRARAHRRVRPDPRRPVHRLRAAHRRGRHGVLLGRRPEVQEPRRRLPRRRRRGAAQRPRPPAPDPLAADPGHRPRQRLRHRRRPRAPRRVRPVDRERQRDLRPGRAAGRELRRRVRHRPARAPRRRQEGEGDLVPVPPVLGRTRRWR